MGTASFQQSSTPHVALLIEVSCAHARGLLRGISAYAQEHGPWRLHLIEQVRSADLRRWLERCPCDGMIARVETPQIAGMLARRGLPVINVGGATTRFPWPRVDTDNQAVCSLAAGHLMECGYRTFGFCGMPRHEWSHWRRTGFVEALSGQGFECDCLDLPSLTTETRPAASDRRALDQWIARLPKPVGIMAANDHCGQVVLEACNDAGLAVPDEVGVIGVDNDELVCQLCWPALSSIEANSERIGYIAASAMAEMLKAGRCGFGEELIKPITLVHRRSTDATAVREPILAEALRFVRAYGCQDIHAMNVARHVKVSRRFLEQQFRQILGRSIHTEIQRVRLEMAQRLLGGTDWKLQTIAERSGFRQASHMSAVFHAKLRLRPGQYRQRMQSGPG